MGVKISAISALQLTNVTTHDGSKNMSNGKNKYWLLHIHMNGSDTQQEVRTSIDCYTYMLT